MAGRGRDVKAGVDIMEKEKGREKGKGKGKGRAKEKERCEEMRKVSAQGCHSTGVRDFS